MLQMIRIVSLEEMDDAIFLDYSYQIYSIEFSILNTILFSSVYCCVSS